MSRPTKKLSSRYLRRGLQRGQAMVFSLIFFAASIMIFFLVYNQGQLLRSRVQIENTADAVAYSQAKLGARNMNLIAYSNRAMIANEITMGQFASIVSWGRRYRNTQEWTSGPGPNQFAPYRTPIAPPAPRPTFGDILAVLYSPYIAIGYGAEASGRTLARTNPGIALFNKAIGYFQQLFALATVQAQISTTLDVVDKHEFPQASEQELYVPMAGFYYLVQNSVLTYSGDTFSADNIAASLNNAGGRSDSDEELLREFLGYSLGDGPATMIERNSPIANCGAGNCDATAAAYQRFASIVNDNRDGFSLDRHSAMGADCQGFVFGTAQPRPCPPIEIPLFPAVFTIDITFFAGSQSDGGTVYRFAPNSTDDPMSLGWSAVDMTSLGLELDVAVHIEVCVPDPTGTIDICTGTDITFPPIDAAFPVGGAVYQMVNEINDARFNIFQFGQINMHESGAPYDVVHGQAFDAFHLVSLSHLSFATLPPINSQPVYVDTSSGGPPMFMSLSETFREVGESYEYTAAVAKSMGSISTTDNNQRLQVGNNSEASSFVQFNVDTRATADDSAYQRTFWQDSQPMTTVSSAEIYYANMWQDGEANLFGPFWDARLVEPSAVTEFIATGEVDWNNLIPGLAGGSRGFVRYLLDQMAAELSDQAIDYITDPIGAPFDRAARNQLQDWTTDLTDQANDTIMDELDDYLP